MEQYSLIGIILLALFGLRRFVNMDIGLVFRAVKDNDQAVKASGLSITFYKTLAVFISSGLACLAGAYLVHIYMWAGISTLALDFSIIPIAATVIGGGGTLVGPVLGALDPGAHFGTAAGLRHLADRLLFPDPDGLYRLSQRGDHGLRPAQIPPV